MRNSDKFLEDKNFFWGAATSAYQVEGGNKNDWSEAAAKAGQTGFDAGSAAGHYSRFEKDFDLARSLGHNAQRISIEWSRIEPEKGKFNKKEIEHYREVLKAFWERGLEPFVTLWHFTNPIWFSKLGGFENKKAKDYFARYADFLAQNFQDVRYWITVNEPMIYAINAYARGIWPPQEKSLSHYLMVISHLVKAHKVAYQIIHKNIPAAQVGIAQNVIYFDVFNKNPITYLLKWLSGYFWNHHFLNQISEKQDFIGVNYYSRKLVRVSKKIKDCFCDNPKGVLSDLGWEIYPEGLYHVLKDLKKYNKPIYITENGLADAKDQKREQFIKDHVYWMKKAMAKGVDVRGYFYWSLIDNFEWERGFEPRFGLIEVDYRTMERKIRPSAYAYKNIIKENS